MANRYLRTVRVTVGDDGDDGDGELVVQALYIRFRVRREAIDKPMDGEIDVYNLNDSNETRIRERGRRVLLEAGYGDTLNMVIDGHVRRVERQRVGLDRVTRIHVGGDAVKRRKIFVHGHVDSIPVRDTVRLAVETMGFEVGPTDVIPEDATETDFRYNGPARVYLNQALHPLGVNWYEAEGVVHFTAFEKTTDDRPEGIVVSERTGMIGTPATTDDGVRVRTQLDTRLRIDTRFRLESTILSIASLGDSENVRSAEITGSETWKVVSVEHRGDNREGDFSTTVDGRPVT